MSKTNWLVSVSPTISVRESEDGASILRFISGYNPDCNVAAFIFTGEKLDLIHGYFNDKANVDFSKLMEHVEDVCYHEKQITLKVHQCGRFRVSYIKDRVFYLYLGLFVVAIGQMDTEGQLKINITSGYDAGHREVLTKVMTKLVKESKYYRDPELMVLRSKVMSYINALSKDEYFEMRYTLGLAVTSLDKVPEVVNTSPAITLERMLTVLKHNRDMKTTVCDFRFFPPSGEDDVHNGVYMSESSGRDIGNGYRSVLYSRVPHISFISSTPIVSMTEFFLKGWLKEMAVASGTEEAFFNRYSFIGFDNYSDLIKSSVKRILNEHNSRS